MFTVFIISVNIKIVTPFRNRFAAVLVLVLIFPVLPGHHVRLRVACASAKRYNASLKATSRQSPHGNNKQRMHHAGHSGLQGRQSDERAPRP